MDWVGLGNIVESQRNSIHLVVKSLKVPSKCNKETEESKCGHPRGHFGYQIPSSLLHFEGQTWGMVRWKSKVLEPKGIPRGQGEV